MSRRRVKLVLLCEDSQHEAFLRRFFERAGWNPRAMRVEKSPKGRGAGEQWVRERFPRELQALRRRHVAAILAAMVDADRSTVEERIAAFDAACSQTGVPPRRPDEPVAIFVPRRSIETWIAYLSGRDVNESQAYPKLPLALLRSLTPEQWSRRCVHPEWGTVELAWVVGNYAWHGKHHLAHITTTVERQGWSRGGGV